jgi:pyruvate/2-oxoglutarate dehydrogenase complex dihydrolipoamide acyltransferase (E2) component
MNANLDKIAQDLYGKIQTRFADIEFGDEEGNVLSKKEDIPKARFFEFEYKEAGQPLGTIAITLDEDDGVVVQVSGDLVDDNNDIHGGAYSFIKGFRKFARNRLLNFDVQNIGKSELDKRDYEFQAKRKEENIMENKLYGTNKISYQDLGEARLVIKHSQPVNLGLAAGRTMHIESIYIENADGERFKYPYKHINGARALAEHIKHGGTPYDAIGQHISGLSEELAHLRKFKGYVSRQEQISEAMGTVTGRVIERIEQIKETISKLQRSAYYESFVETFEAQEEQMIPEEIQNDLIDRLTIRTFNEELKSVFPYIYKFVDESELPIVELGVEDMLGESDKEGTPHSHQAKTTLKHLKKSSYGDKADAANIKPGIAGYRDRVAMLKRAEEEDNLKVDEFMNAGHGLDVDGAYESFMNSIHDEAFGASDIEDSLFSKDPEVRANAVEKFNSDVLSQELPAGTAKDTLAGFIDQTEFQDGKASELTNQLYHAIQDLDPNLDVRSLIQDYVQERNPEVAAQLDFGLGGPAPGGEEPAPPPAPEAEPAPPPAPEAPPATPPAAPAPAPVAEDEDEDPPFDGPYTKAKGTVTDKSGAKHTGHSQAKHLAHQGIKSAIAKAKKAGATLDTKLDFGHKEMTLHDAIKECGMSPEQFGFEESGLPAMLKYMSGFYNKDEGNFPLGGTRIKIKVKKAFEDGEFGSANPEDLMKVLKFIDMKDPSGDIQQDTRQLVDIKRLAGVPVQSQKISTASSAGLPNFDDKMKHLHGHINSITQDAPSQMQQLLQKLKFGN